MDLKQGKRRTNYDDDDGHLNSSNKKYINSDSLHHTFQCKFHSNECNCFCSYWTCSSNHNNSNSNSNNDYDYEHNQNWMHHHINEPYSKESNQCNINSSDHSCADSRILENHVHQIIDHQSNKSVNRRRLPVAISCKNLILNSPLSPSSPSSTTTIKSRSNQAECSAIGLIICTVTLSILAISSCSSFLVGPVSALSTTTTTATTSSSAPSSVFTTTSTSNPKLITGSASAISTHSILPASAAYFEMASGGGAPVTGAGTFLPPRPTPFSPEYRPECDIILPASLSMLTSPADEDIGDVHSSIESTDEEHQSYYFPGPGSGAGSPQENHHIIMTDHHLYAAANNHHKYVPRPLETEKEEEIEEKNSKIGNPTLISRKARSHRPQKMLMAASSTSSSILMNPIIQKYLFGMTKRSSSYLPGGHICITYDDINQAVQQAKMELGIYQLPYENRELSSDYPKPQHVAKVGELVVKASEIFARMHGLTKEAIVYGLPRIDTTRTVIGEFCPAFLKPVKCEISKYRTLSGMCNNLEYPSWGSARSAMLRYLPPDYADGLTSPRVGKNGQPLPPPRVVSFVLHQDDNDYDHEVTYLVIAWGQMVDHDLTFASMPKDNNDKAVKCCKYPQQQRHRSCYPIQVPSNDPYYKFYPRKCMDFVRSTAGVKPNCPLGPRHQINVVSSYLDADIIYGHSLATTKRLREFNGGRLKTTKMYKNLGLKDLLPQKTQNPDQGCERGGMHGSVSGTNMHTAINNYCFDTGDDRSNVQLQLTVMHTIWMRHHNQIAEVLAEINPHWNDEKLFQESRRLVGAMIQHITFNEFLPIVVGRKTMTKYGLNLLKYGYYHGYDPKLNPGIRVEFQAAAFRFGHSIVPDTVDRYNKFHQKLESVRLASLLRQPFSLYHPGVLDTFIMGLINQPAYRVDQSLANEMTNHLFQKPGEQFGLDLAAINILRGREMGVPGYNYIREYCGLPRLRYFSDLHGLVQNTTIRRYMELYDHVDDIDFWSAGIAEYPLMGAMVGPTFACIIAEQFAQIRKGDRFWYENGQGLNKFSMEQLNEIRKVKLARILCEASDELETIQLYPLLAAHPTTNPRVNCDELPEMDLSSWRDASSSSSYMPFPTAGGLLTDPNEYKKAAKKAA